MKKAEIIRLLELFRYKENDRPELNNYLDVSYNDKTYVGTTTTHHFIIIRVWNTKIATKNGVNLSAHIPFPNCKNEISVKELSEKRRMIRLVKLEKERSCPDCFGTGQEFDSDGWVGYCERCGGSGGIGTGEFESFIDPTVQMKLKDNFLDNRYISKLIEVCNVTNSKKIHLVHQNGEGVNLFKINEEILVGIMPMRQDIYNEFVTIDLKNSA